MRERREAFRDARLIVIASEGIERARALDKNPTDRWPQTLGTRISDKKLTTYKDHT